MKLQQGDVILRTVKKIPKGKRMEHLTLAYGEATGHHHTITEGACELYEVNGVLYLHVGDGGGVLTHQKHHAIEVPAGDYIINKVREWDAFAEEARNVQD